MTLTSALERLRAHEPELRAQGVGSLYLFGSTVRGEAREDSDLDIFFDDAPGAVLSLLDVIGIEQFLQDALAMRIDLMTRDCLHPLLRADIESEAV